MDNQANLVASFLNLPITTLSNGLRVANFSSPHPFTFVDGTVLPACTAERSTAMQLFCQEEESVNLEAARSSLAAGKAVRVIDLEITWRMSNTVRVELLRLKDSKEFDVLLIPLPVMTAMKDEGMSIGKARCVRMSDRVSKASHIDRFCK